VRPQLAQTKPTQGATNPPLFLSGRISLFFFRISLFLLDKASGMVIKVP
jgi:hypothetical protein